MLNRNRKRYASTARPILAGTSTILDKERRRFANRGIKKATTLEEAIELPIAFVSRLMHTLRQILRALFSGQDYLRSFDTMTSKDWEGISLRITWVLAFLFLAACTAFPSAELHLDEKFAVITALANFSENLLSLKSFEWWCRFGAVLSVAYLALSLTGTLVGAVGRLDSARSRTAVLATSVFAALITAFSQLTIFVALTYFGLAYGLSKETVLKSKAIIGGVIIILLIILLLTSGLVLYRVFNSARRASSNRLRSAIAATVFTLASVMSPAAVVEGVIQVSLGFELMDKKIAEIHKQIKHASESDPASLIVAPLEISEQGGGCNEKEDELQCHILLRTSSSKSAFLLPTSRLALVPSTQKNDDELFYVPGQLFVTGRELQEMVHITEQGISVRFTLSLKALCAQRLYKEMDRTSSASSMNNLVLQAHYAVFHAPDIDADSATILSRIAVTSDIESWCNGWAARWERRRPSYKKIDYGIALYVGLGEVIGLAMSEMLEDCGRLSDELEPESNRALDRTVGIPDAASINICATALAKDLIHGVGMLPLLSNADSKQLLEETQRFSRLLAIEAAKLSSTLKAQSPNSAVGRKAIKEYLDMRRILSHSMNGIYWGDVPFSPKEAVFLDSPVYVYSKFRDVFVALQVFRIKGCLERWGRHELVRVQRGEAMDTHEMAQCINSAAAQADIHPKLKLLQRDHERFLKNLEFLKQPIHRVALELRGTLNQLPSTKNSTYQDLAMQTYRRSSEQVIDSLLRTAWVPATSLFSDR